MSIILICKHTKLGISAVCIKLYITLYIKLYIKCHITAKMIRLKNVEKCDITAKLRCALSL